MTVDQFLERWFKSVGDFRGNEMAMRDMKADLEGMLNEAADKAYNSGLFDGGL